MNICTSSNLYSSAAELRYSELQRYNVRPVAGTIVEPIALEDAWRHLNLVPWGSPEGTEHDDWLEMIGIPGARSWCEAYLAQTIAQQSLELVTNQFPSTDYIDLPFGPVLEIESVTYIDEDGNLVDWPDPGASPVEEPWLLDTYENPARLYLAYGYEWPDDVRDVPNSITIRYIAGYTLEGDSPNNVPLSYRTRIALLLMLGHLFKNREDTTVLKLDHIPFGVRSFLDWDSDRMVIV